MLLFTLSCVPDDLVPLPDSTPSDPASAQPTEGMTVLGRQLENPYSVENMRKAYKLLQQSDRKEVQDVLQDIKIYTSHRYIKFFPSDEADLDKLANDSTLSLYSFPLDYEIIEQGYYYHDPSVPLDKPTPMYCAVPADYTLPSVSHEVLADLFIPQEVALAGGDISTDMAYALAYEAEKMTGNLEEETASPSDPRFRTQGTYWTPRGRIRVWDDSLGQTRRSRNVRWVEKDCPTNYVNKNRVPDGETNDGVAETCGYWIKEYYSVPGGYVPLVGAQVWARRWWRTSKGITDSYGNYRGHLSFRYTARHFIPWDRYEFTVRSGLVGRANYPSSYRSSPWYVNIKGGRQAYYAHIFRAAHQYYYEDIKELKRPPTNAGDKPQMKIAAYYLNNDDSNGTCSQYFRLFGIFPRIAIYNPYRSIIGIYSTTIHELAHSSHWELRKNNWIKTSDKVIESWARGVEWELTRMIYPSYEGRERRRNDYTLVVADMIDDPSTDSTNYGYGRHKKDGTKDEVSGYTIKQIEDVLSNTSSWYDWKNNIKKEYYNGTENKLDKLFNNWN